MRIFENWRLFTNFFAKNSKNVKYQINMILIFYAHAFHNGKLEETDSRNKVRVKSTIPNVVLSLQVIFNYNSSRSSTKPESSRTDSTSLVSQFTKFNFHSAVAFLFLPLASPSVLVSELMTSRYL